MNQTEPASHLRDRAPLPIHPLRPATLEAFLSQLDPPSARFVRAQGFSAEAHSLVLLPGGEGIAAALLGLGDDHSMAPFGGLSEKLPAGTAWQLMPGPYDVQIAELGIALGGYRFERFKQKRRPVALVNAGPGASRARAVADAICFARDLINTPANLLGPAELADAGADLAAKFAARVGRVTGEALHEGYPALYAVGAGSARPPQMLHFTWGDDPDLPLIALCGKGVCFDTGGNDIKPSAAMLRMKKDMGGAAITLGIAHAVMTLGIPVRLDIRIGCVENSVSGTAMRPLDILRTRSGLMVEVGNTDAEGRLVLADLLTDAAAGHPDWLIDFATLTGAARVALGPDLPALFSTSDELAESLLAAGRAAHDPLWRLPLWEGYDPWLDSTVGDFNSVGSRPMAGAIVAALFLKRFVPASVAWAHLDTYAWNDNSRPGRPEGGEAQSLHAAVTAIEGFASTARR